MTYRLFHRLAHVAVLCIAALAIDRVQAQAITHQITLPSGVTWCDDTMINNLFTTINAFRVQKGVSALQMNTLGMKDAEMRAVQFSAYMATHAPGSTGFNPHEGYDTTAASLGYNLISENLAYITTDVNYIVYSGWQDSLHLAALLASDANVMGVSCVYSNGVPFWTYEPGIGSGGSTQPPSNPPPTPSPGTTSGIPVLDSEQWNFLTLINNYRAQNGVGPLQVSVILQNSSQWMSNDLATHNYFSHTDSLGRSTGARLLDFGYNFSPWGENIAGGFSDAQSALDGWENACDPDASGACTYAHRKNMLNGSFVAIGIGRAYGANSPYGWYWTTDFGGVLDQAVTPSNQGTGSAPTIGSFTATPSTITAGSSSNLSWSVTGATSISLDNGIGDVSTLTSKTVVPAQTTTYKLTVANSSGTVTAVVTVTVNAPVGDTQPPTTPTLTSATAKTSTEVDLAWTASADNIGVAGYQILRNGSLLVKVASTPLSYADMSVSAGATYTYSIKAFDAAGNISGTSNSIQVTTPVPQTTVTCPAAGSGAFTGCYYNNISLTGNPVLARTDPQVNFDWGGGPPDAAVTPRNFSVRWQGYFAFDAGDYTFTAITSDGMRIYIDGTLVLDSWRDQSANMYTVGRTVTQGQHLLAVEYYEHTGTATAHFSWQTNVRGSRLGQPPAIASFNASPTAIQAGQSAILSWSVSSATAISIDNSIGDVTSVTARTVSPAQTTTYRLTATNSSGSTSATVTVSVSAAVSDKQPPTTPSLTSVVTKSASEVDLTWTASTDNVGVAGYQVIRNGSLLAQVPASSLTYADTGTVANTTYTYTIKSYDGAGNLSAASNTAQVTTPPPSTSSSCPPPAASAFAGCYFGNITLSGTPVLTRTDAQINFDWLSGTPDPRLPPYNFSARWQGYFNFNQGDYTFTAITSDGMRLYIDGALVLDSWRDQAAYVYTAARNLTQGQHLVVVEYYEHTGTATAHLSWQPGISTSRR